jgi:hypothetical protein
MNDDDGVCLERKLIFLHKHEEGGSGEQWRENVAIAGRKESGE